MCTKLDNQIDPENTFKTFDFIEKTVTIGEEITPDTAAEVIKTIRFWNSVDYGTEIEERDPIVIFINTNGGDLNATLSIIAAIKLSKTPVYTVNLGTALSGGFLILISGHMRFTVPYASYLFHEGANGVVGDAHKVLQQADYYKEQLLNIKEIVLSNTQITQELYEKHRKDDWWFGNETAIKYKVIDKVINNFNFIEEDFQRKEDYE
jgi:ATP-dependent Clp protease protease subunit